MSWIILIVMIGFLLDREIYFYEGVHLGPRMQAWLYDRWSKKYDEGKRASQLRDDEMLSQPLLGALGAVPRPFILDFATGTGRLSYALLNRSDFGGKIVALDLSQGMLEQAASKIQTASVLRQENTVTSLPKEHAIPTQIAQVEFLRHLSLPLPFPDSAFDVVCALEVLEHFPTMDEPLHELIRVLRPGGILLTSRGTEESGRRAKVKSTSEFSSLLEKHGIERIHLTKWWKFYDRVLGAKPGFLEPAPAMTLSQVLKCTACASIDWAETSDRWICRRCGRNLSLTQKGIVLN